ncbi:MAG TPA: hypothetical protein VG733_11045, partial [Chthoniobacteraceae bacterium]|nr:hypothetical protein [Chthoniobacteraceae bacterium]
MPQIRRIRKRKLRQPAHLEEELPVIDPVAVKAQLNSFLARWTIAAIYVLIIGAVTLVYGQVIEHKFIDLGDKAAVYGNPLVTSGLNSSAVMRVLNPFRIDYLNAGFYSPITVLTHMANWTSRSQVLEDRSPAYHLVNAILHGLTAIMLFRVLRLVTGTIWRSALVAALFAIHPMQVETVAWVAERGTVLSGLFLVLALDAYVRYVYRPWSLVRYLTVLVLFVLGLLCKPAL